MSKFKAIRWLKQANENDRRISLVWAISENMFLGSGRDVGRVFTTRNKAQEYADLFGIRGKVISLILEDWKP